MLSNSDEADFWCLTVPSNQEVSAQIPKGNNLGVEQYELKTTGIYNIPGCGKSTKPCNDLEIHLWWYEGAEYLHGMQQWK
jgi:hypothetical protein